MSFWVAKNRQKPPEENAFAQRARRNRRGQEPPQAAPEPVSEPEKTPEPSEVADAMPDLQALREAAQKAAAVIHEKDEAKAEGKLDEFLAVEPEKPRRGRKPSPEVQARNARVLEIVKNAEQVGISKPDIAAIMEEKEQQVYTSLRQLQAEGLVESKYLDGLGYRWLAV
jgi:hypothetical protein